MVGNFVEEYTVDEMKESPHQCSLAITKLIQQEINRILKGKQIIISEKVNFAQIFYFAGNSITKPKHIFLKAINYICAFRNMFTTLKPLTKKIIVHLSNNATKLIELHGDIRLHDSLILRDVLYISSFKHNLQSVDRLVQKNYLKCTVYPELCVFRT